MAISRQKKEDILSVLKDRLAKAKVVVFVNFHGLTTDLSQKIRRLMRESEAKYFVAKKTLVKKALNEAGLKGDIPDMEGELALVFGTGDAVLPVKNISKFSKEYESITMLGGILDDEYMDKNKVLYLSKLPSKEVLLGQFVGIINAPRQQMVGVLSGVQRNLLNVLSQINK